MCWTVHNPRAIRCKSNPHQICQHSKNTTLDKFAETGEICGRSLQCPTRVRAIIWVIMCWVAAAHIQHSADWDHSVSHTMQELAKDVKYKKRLTQVNFFLFIQNFRKIGSLAFATPKKLAGWLKVSIAKSRLLASVALQTWGVETCANLSQLECWIMNTKSTQPNKPRC